MEQALSTHELTNLLWFAGWLVAIAVLFVLALRLPLQTRLRRFGTRIYVAAIVVAALAIGALAVIGLALHDVHFDLTRERIFTPSERALQVVDRLDRPVKLTYFFQGEDRAGRRAKEIVEVMGHRNRLLEVQTVDPDKHPTLAQTAGVKVYNAAVLEADGRRILVRTTDENEIAIGIQRVLRQRVVNICYIEGHNEYPVDNFEFHTHFEGLVGHSHGDANSAVVQTTGHGIGRMRRSLEALGYDVRKVILATEGTIPTDCVVTIDAGPRTTYLPAESAALESYLQQGGALLLMYDLGFVLEPRLEKLLLTLGVRFEQAVIVDPKSHYGTDPEMVAVTAYDPHPITKNVSFTFYPGARSMQLVPTAPEIRTLPLISSSNESYLKTVTPVVQRELASTPAAPLDAHEQAPAPHVFAAAIEGKLPEASSKPFRALVVGDGDFASNSFFPYMANSDLALSMVRWLVHEEANTPVASRIPVPAMILLTRGQMQVVFLLVEVLLPLLVIVIGGIIWWRRR
ncbi:MAG: GldG family protein [Betaproteobacteria bacterium]